jgi:ubiquinone/menaquinone biosynthesis C-methylase UbiE
MPAQPVNYDIVADVFNLRYQQTYTPDGIAQKLVNIVNQTQSQNVLEVGCGTGHWIEILQNQAYVVGLDYSYNMLNKIDPNNGCFSLIQADSARLPFVEESFDFIYCVNAFHHFNQQEAFITNAKNLLKKNGTLAIIGMAPHAKTDSWFVYDFFPQTLEADLQRFPSLQQITQWMDRAGFYNTQTQKAEQLYRNLNIEEVLALSKNYTSQLSQLSNREYDEGLGRIRAAASQDSNYQFKVDISLMMVTTEKF